jgi:hypothetical protein
MMPPPINSTSVSCSWRVLVRGVFEPTAGELGTAIFFFIEFEPYFTRFFLFSAGDTIIRNQSNTEDKKFKYCLKFKLSFEICYKNV